MGKLSEPNRKRGDTKKLTLPKNHLQLKSKSISLSVVYIVFLIFISLLALFVFFVLIRYYSNKVIERNIKSFRKTYIESKKKEVKNDVLKIINSIDSYRSEEKVRIADNLNSTLKKVYKVYLKLSEYSKIQNRSDDIELFLKYIFLHNGKYHVLFFKNYESFLKLLEKAAHTKNKFYNSKFPQDMPIEIKGKLKNWNKVEGFLLCSKAIDRCIFVFESQYRIAREIKKEVLRHIEHFNMVSNKNKYMFINKINGEVLILNNKIIDNGTKLWHIKKNTYNKMKEIFKKEIQAYKRGGGFITYTWYGLKTGKKTKQTIYIGYYKPWKWIVCEGFCNNYVDVIIANISGKIHYYLYVIIRTLYMLVALVFIIIIFTFLGFTGILDYKKEKIMKQFKKSLDRNKKIDVDRYKLKEIKEFAEDINRTIDIFKRYEEEFIVALINAVEVRDTYTQGHSQRVAYYSKVIAETFGFDEEKQEEVYRAGLLHDIGKIGIPDIILLKPDKLTTYEYEIIKYHSVFSFEIVSKISRFKKMAKYIRHHHERCDGSGYPDGLKCDEIEIEARILAIADVFDALTSKRVYREQLNPEEALRIIEKDELDQSIVNKVKDKLIEAFLSEENNEEKPYITKVDRIRKELFETDFKTGLKRRKTITNKSVDLMLDKKPFIIALLKINNHNILVKSSFKEADFIISDLSKSLKETLIKKRIYTEFISYAFDDAFLILIEIENTGELGKIKKTLDKLPQELAKTINTKLKLSISYKVFPEEFDSDFDSVLTKLRVGE